MGSLDRLARLVSTVSLVWLAGCGGGGSSEAPIAPTYANVEQIIRQSCVFSSCHGDPGGQGQMNFQTYLDQGMPITQALVNVPACEYYLMPRVDPGHPENSWIMIKLDPAHSDASGNIVFTPDPSFDPAMTPYTSSACPLMSGNQVVFGASMPYHPGMPTPLTNAQLTAIRQWIADGAPGPSVDAGTSTDAAIPTDAATDGG